MERNFTGKTVDDAIKAASEELGLSREDFTVEVLENPKSGFLGLGAKPAVIKVVYKNEVNAVEFVEDFLNGLMEKMGIMEYELKVTEPEEKSIRAELNGSELAALIRKRSEVIDAVQSMTALAMNRHIEEYYKISVDINSGRERNTARLENLAVKVAKQVQKTKRKVTLSSMNSAKRRVIHSKLQDFENIQYLTFTTPETDVDMAKMLKGIGQHIGASRGARAQTLSSEKRRRQKALRKRRLREQERLQKAAQR